MSNFIVPISGLPPIASLAGASGAQKAQQGAAGGLSFASYLQDAVQNLTATGAQSQANLYSMALGGADDLHSGAIDAIKASTAVSYTTGLASAAIRAYNELIKMQV